MYQITKKSKLPYGVVNANPMKTVYKFGNDTLETKTHPTYGNNIYSTNHNKYIKQYSDMEYSRLKDPIQRKVKEEQLKDKFEFRYCIYEQRKNKKAF